MKKNPAGSLKIQPLTLNLMTKAISPDLINSSSSRRIVKNI